MALLDSIGSAADIRRLDMEQRLSLAEEIRARLVEVICRNGGHLASSLGVVELTIALLSVYDPPRDRIIWDVGHQSYPYKLLTGRASRFDTIRTAGGLSGFPRRDESECDSFGTGHSSTAISAALGFAISRDLRGTGERVVAIVGDGAMTGGMAIEGLNNLGHSRTDMTIILNDNEMSISPNVGALHGYLARLLTDPRYNKFRSDLWNLLGRVPSVGERMRRAGHIAGAALKKTIVPGRTFFDDFGVRYIGPIPGNDLPTLTGVLDRVSRLRGPVLVHVNTMKGKGYDPAECDSTAWHGISGECSERRDGRSFTSAFSEAMVEIGATNQVAAAITAAMRDGTGLTEFASRYPERFFDVGIAEQHAVTFACGLAFGGMKPVVAVYSTFIQRAVDQVIHDAALQKAPVVIALDRAGVVGEDGPTHQGVFDIALLRPVPNLMMAAPRDCDSLSSLLKKAVAMPGGPVVLRYPRGSEPDRRRPFLSDPVPGRGQLLREGGDILIVGCGPLASDALDAAVILAARGISAAVFDPVWLKPAPLSQIAEAAPSGRILCVEDGCASGGFGEYLAAELSPLGFTVRAKGFPDMFQQHGSRSSLLEAAGLCPVAIAATAEEMMG